MWRFIDVDKVDGAYSTALFQSIGRHVGSGTSDETILFWRVSNPALYLGYHQYVEDEVHEAYCQANNIDVIRRILGGGCGYCDSDQILFAVIGTSGGIISTNIQEAYKKVLLGVVSALSILGLEGEFDQTRNGVFVGGRKISGNAQGRFDGSVMVNGSFLLDFDFETMDQVLKHPTKNLRPHVNTARQGMITLSDLMELPDLEEIKQALRAGFEDALGIGTYDGQLSEAEIILAQELTTLYTSRDWIYRMDDKRKKRREKEMVLEDYLKGIHKSKGGIIRSFLKVDNGLISDISFSGDFFMFPEDAIDVILARLNGTAATEEAVLSAVKEVYESEGIQSPGTTPEDFTISIMQAIGRK
ncbi:MAG TPA: lipoate--protein ligase [archaeon]|nr:lipoate--protein ligase [archaeon]